MRKEEEQQCASQASTLCDAPPERVRSQCESRPADSKEADPDGKRCTAGRLSG